MLRKIRIIIATLFFLGITSLLLGLGSAAGDTSWWGKVLDFMPKMQFLPAVLSLNIGVILLILAVTLLMGRVYCSVVCPLGIFQDLISWISVRMDRYRKKKKKPARRKFHFHYRPEKKWIRYGLFSLFVLALLTGFQVFVLLLAPYSLYGRFVYALFHHSAWAVTAVSVGTVLLVAVLAFLFGREWCNTVCPVGTALSLVSRHALFRPVIDADHCKSCRLCEHRCKSNCIDITRHRIDYSRCVDCFDCLDACHFDALHYRFAYRKPAAPAEREPAPGPQPAAPDSARRAFLVTTALAGVSLAQAAADEKRKRVQQLLKEKDPERTDLDKRRKRLKTEPERLLPVVPPGAVSRKHFYDHCTACHLCVISCPEQIIRPGMSFDHFMQVELTYAGKACNPECNRCSQVCPSGAILPYLLEDKKHHASGHAVVDPEQCFAYAKGAKCGVCARYCPYDAIEMTAANPLSRRGPVVQKDRCVGCGACELHCPVQPVSAIHVEGLEK